MKRRALFAAPLLIAIALHAWASGAYPADAFIAAFALAAIPLGERIPFGPTAQRVVAVLGFVVGAGIGWSHSPALGYGPGALPRAASLIAVGAILAAAARLYVRAGWSRERATFILGTVAVAASGSTRLGPGYAAFAAAYVLLSLVALRARDPARASALGLPLRHRIALAAAVALTSILAFGVTRAIVPLHDLVQQAIERSFLVHDMVGFGAGSTLGEMRDMIQSDVEVLRVAPPRRSAPVDYLRGAVYDEYRSDGFWSESPFAEHLRDIAVGSDLAAGGPGVVRIHRVAGTAGRYFLPLNVRDVRVVTGALEADELGSTLTVGSERATEYSFVLGPRDKLVPAAPRPPDLRIPRSEEEPLTQLAREWTAGAARAPDQLDAIAAHLDRDYHYSLTLVRDAEDPLLDFLFRQKVGYCTYFASAMTMLARARAIPARLVTGYRVAEWSPVTGEYVVREKNAHAWVEAWVEGAWRTYDPTPMAELPQDRSHLAALGTLAADVLLRAEQAATYAVEHATPTQLVIALSLLGVLWGAVRWMRQREITGGRSRVERERDPPLPCFGSLLSFLARSGLTRGGSEPLEHFARRLDDAGLKEAAQLVDRYAAFRYGGLGDRGALDRDVARFVRGGERAAAR